MRIAAFVGDAQEDYEILLAEGRAACIDPAGHIYIGEQLVRGDESLLLSVLAHEIGHRPKTWKKLHQGHGFTREQLVAFARNEEAKADRGSYWIGDPPGKSVGMRPRTTCVSLVT